MKCEKCGKKITHISDFAKCDVYWFASNIFKKKVKCFLLFLLQKY